MELFGKVVSNGSSNQSSNSNPELLVNINNGRITVSSQVISKLGENLTIGFGYDAEQEQGHKAYLYVAEGGCKVGKGGTVSSKFHATELKSMFLDAESVTTRFRLNVLMGDDDTIEFQNHTLYPITFKEELKDLVRSKKDNSVEEEEVTMEAKDDAKATVDETNPDDLNQGDENIDTEEGNGSFAETKQEQVELD